jgi:hypothetical protein
MAVIGDWYSSVAQCLKVSEIMSKRKLSSTPTERRSVLGIVRCASSNHNIHYGISIEHS